MVNNTVIRLENVSKFYKLYNSPKLRLKEALHPFGKKYHKEFFALKNVSLTVQKGEVLGIVGRNGSGKSTLLKLIAGVLIPSSGLISVTGQVNALLELGSGLNPEFTGLQNIYFMGSVNGFAQKEMADKVQEVIDFSELGDFIHQPLKSYSSGMKARLGFAIATTILPEILILDEVLSVGDALFRRKSFAKMEQLISENRTVLFVSHNEQSVRSICTRAVLLNQGELLFSGKPDETVNLYLELLYAKDREKFVLQKIEKKDEVVAFAEEINPEETVIATKSMQYIRIHNADIRDIEIVDTDGGNPVRMLSTGREYRICFSAHIQEKYDNIAAAVAIVNEKGVRIAGISPRLAGKTVKNDKDDVVVPFEFNFHCHLLPGYYYLAVCVLGDVNGTNAELCNVRDAVCLHVISDKDECVHKFGIVNLLD